MCGLSLNGNVWKKIREGHDTHSSRFYSLKDCNKPIIFIALLCLLQDPEQLQDKSNEILTAIIQGMRKEEPSNNVKLAATNALLNSLEFTKANFDKEVCFF